MKNNWQTKKLGEVCDIFNGNSINAKLKKEKYLNIVDGYSYIGTKDVGFDAVINYENGVKIPSNESRFRISKKNSVLICAEGGSAGRKIGFTEKDICFGNKLFSIYSDKHSNKFIYYFCLTDCFQEEFKKNLTGIIGGVSLKKFKQIQIPLPPLPEQIRIVKILDEVFGKMEIAKKNAERNLRNAKELFESYLQSVFANKGDNWEEKRLVEVLKLEYGKPLDKKDRNKSGKFPVYGANGEKDRTDKFYYDKLTIIVGRKGSAGELNLTENKFWPLDVTYFVTFDNKKYDLKFIYFLLLTLKLTKLAKGVKPGINRNDVYSISVFIPNLKFQKQIVSKLDVLSNKTKKLEKNYQQKIDDLDELKKSVLKKAFEGEL